MSTAITYDFDTILQVANLAALRNSAVNNSVLNIRGSTELVALLLDLNSKLACRSNDEDNGSVAGLQVRLGSKIGNENVSLMCLVKRFRRLSLCHEVRGNRCIIDWEGGMIKLRAMSSWNAMRQLAACHSFKHTTNALRQHPLLTCKQRTPGKCL